MKSGKSLLDLDEDELVEMLTPVKLNPLETLAAVAAEKERLVLHAETGATLKTLEKPSGQGSSTQVVVGLSKAGREPGTDQPGEKHSVAEGSEKEWRPLNRNDTSRLDDKRSSTRRRSRKGRETHSRSSRRRRSTSSSSSSSSDQSDEGRTKRVVTEHHRTVDASDRVVKDAHNTHQSQIQGKKEKHRS